MSCEGFKTVVYYSNWSVYARKHFAIDMPTDVITHIFYAFIHIDTTTGKLKFTDEWCDLQLPMVSPKDPTKQVTGSLQQIYQMKQLNRNLKVVMSIGGWGTDHMFTAVTEDKQKMVNFVNSCGDFISEYGFDGVDIDWEYPKNAHENELLIKLLRDLRAKLNSIDSTLSLSIAAPAGCQNIQILNLPEIDKYLSFWNLMLYDFAGNGWSSKTGFHSNLFGNNGDNQLNVDDTVKVYLNSGINPKKLVIGMPLYGRAFFGSPSNGIGQSFTKERAPNLPVETETVDYHMLPIGQPEFDHRKVGASCYDANSKLFISYDSVDSMRIKATYLALKNLGGGMWWDSAGDCKDPSKSLIRNFVNQLGCDKLEKSPNHVNLHQESNYLKELLS